MLWRRAAPSPVVPCTTPVPDADRLRLMALQASWTRGRWVARRRVALRWLLWIGTRYLMPALAVSGVAAWLWLGWLRDAGDPMQQIAGWMEQRLTTSSEPATAAMPTASPTSTTTNEPTDVIAQTIEAVGQPTHNPEGDLIDSPAFLKLETRWAAATRSPPAGVSAEVTLTEPDPYPLLKPENWLHSKEP